MHAHGSHEHHHAEHEPHGHEHEHEPHEHEHEHEPHEHEHPHDHAHPHEHPHDHGHAHPHQGSKSADFHRHDDALSRVVQPASHAHGPVSELGHEGAHVHEDAPVLPLLKEGEGRDKVLFLDAFSGVAGDMTIAALLDLGVPLLVVERAIAALPIEGFHLHRGHAHRSAIVATSFDVHLESEQPYRDFAQIDAMLSSSPLEDKTKELARRIFRTLAESEARVHRMPVEKVHFHEVGAVDAIVDIVGAAAAFTYLGARVVCSPLPMGRGFIRAEHGMLPNPPPAVVNCLKGVPTVSVDLDVELVTPTGAAIVATIAESFVRWPTIAPDRVGYGAGKRELPDRPNLLRAVLGSTHVSDVAGGSGSHVLLEANVDDMTGELAAHAIEQLLEKGALDAWTSPVTMKKGRPGLVLSVICDASAESEVTKALLAETTTLGVRRLLATRTERPRKIVTVATTFGDVRVKISGGPFGPPQIKPEYDDCAALARKANVPLREVIRAALVAAAEAAAT
ncbi:MAG: nickel pincer cofactor biosynthesis protein LarC [Polyangiaceae bacterium]|nr:nickel pincer cofactor biosynthesis protein LarC [Polyangiaceae bacterium]